MKTIAILALATLTLAAAPASHAAEYGYRTVGYCAPYIVCTKEVCRRTVCQYAYDHCGRRYSHQVVVVTYANHYSDGSTRTFIRSFRA